MRYRTASGDRPDDIPDAAFAATATTDERGIVTGWSEGAQQMLGYRPEDIVGRPAADLLAEDVKEMARQPRDGLLERWSGRATLQHRDGHRVGVRVLANRREAEDGAAEWFVVSAVPRQPHPDHSNALVEWTFAQTPCALAIYDTDLRLERANAGMERVLALTEDQIRGLRLSEIATGPEADRTEEAMRLALASGEPQHVESYFRAPGESRKHAWSVSAAPLRDRTGRLRGVCHVAQDMTEQYEARQRLILINEAGTRIGTTLDIAHTAQELADVAVPRLADYMSVDLLTFLHRGDEPLADPLTGGLPTLCHTAQQSVLEGCPDALVEVGAMTTYPAFSAPAEVLATGRPAKYETTESTITRWAADDPAVAAWIREHGTHSMMVVPIRVRGITLGIALFARHRRPEPFERDDLLLAEEITARAAVCIDNARRYGRERTTAETLQRSLLPQRLPTQAAVEVASRYLPAGARAGVGGDWFDAIPLSGERIALVVGDVAGCGLQASATMGRLRTAVRTLADIDLPPDELLTHLDDVVVRLSAETCTTRDAETAGEIGASCLYAVYDPVSRRCTLARAGHPPPAVVTSDETAHILDLPAGPPLGLGGLPFETSEIELPEGSLLALYTDGLIDGRDRDVDEELNTLRNSLVQPAPSLDALCDTVLKALLPARPDDDVALLLARTRALHADQVATWDVPYDPAVVAQARQNASAQLTEWGLDEAIFITELVVSELVTNAIRYGQPPIQLRLIHDRTLICEVSDASSTTPHLRRTRVLDEGGRGLLLVAHLTTRWGTRHSHTGKTIWAEQLLPASRDCK
ncbi:SpoIIE family protein phosphatase [Streptomyces sp. NPDC047009]|uniref:SpoIIE family protein phosphatase n=1 Tax=Streptomyces sp. NPDC047009 TaxID=3154496 RepID=UPI0033D11D22